MQIDIVNEPVASIAAAVEYLGISRQWFYIWRKRGKIQEYRYGTSGRVCFKWSDLQALKESKMLGE